MKDVQVAMSAPRLGGDSRHAHGELWLMSIAPLAFIALFQYLPLAGLVIVFQDYDIFAGFATSEWVGLQNFREVFSDPRFWRVLRNTFVINLYKVVFFFPIPILLAVVITEIPSSKVQKISQTILYLPHFVSWIVIAGLTFTLLGSNGTINQLLATLGIQRVAFMTRPELFRGIVVTSAIWKEAGWGSIIFIAAIVSVDTELYEAAIVDGAGRLRRIWSITLPSILSTIVVLLLIRLGYILLWGTEQILAMYNPTVYETGDVVGSYVFRTGLGSQRYSYSATVGFFNSLVGFLMIIGANSLSRRLTDRSIW